MKVIFAVLMTALTTSVAHADDVSILKKKARAKGGQSGYVINYKHDGKVGQNAKVYCVSGGKPIYLVEGLDRGDGKKLDIMVDGDNGGLATDLAPGYMRWAIDVWRLTCR
ncbi:hypothetical protein VPK21_001360 (plasmid) [Sinorhizobium kummerowiae]|uniref:Uncharacterized protein n=1 Tax=Sinorhizobium kummerowiae TaxID=158892 RepID=A0ABY8TJU8_9HYPH|nr:MULTISPECIES: hypothetical protein [Sinorhizobium]RVN89009.1 hypothetical protein CN105_16425 [Sinorhizobium meliloti]WHS96625.1 hypothetical protein PZL22_005561 [Sinorhizobium kummerowiae]WQH41438.1 hypothetical protein VPK21_001360 [Sinorhizobium kummerowiae]